MVLFAFLLFAGLCVLLAWAFGHGRSSPPGSNGGWGGYGKPHPPKPRPLPPSWDPPDFVPDWVTDAVGLILARSPKSAPRKDLEEPPEGPPDAES